MSLGAVGACRNSVCVCVEGEPVYEACRTKVEKFVYRKLQKASETHMNFFGLGYFYLRAVDLGFIGTTLMLRSENSHSAFQQATVLFLIKTLFLVFWNHLFPSSRTHTHLMCFQRRGPRGPSDCRIMLMQQKEVRWRHQAAKV